MKLIVGLGNPDKTYENTYHNLGFMAVDKTAELLGVEFSKTKCRAKIAETVIGGEKVMLAKPQTYMNLSGESIRELVDFYKLDLSDLLVIYDDFDLFQGELRIRDSGSSGTHNGMRNILLQLGSGDFTRIRIGFKPKLNEFNIPLIDFVLSGIKPDVKEIFEEIILLAGKASVDFAKGIALNRIMQKYNRKSGK